MFEGFAKKLHVIPALGGRTALGTLVLSARGHHGGDLPA